MPLNENEERILHEIEQRFYDHDPESANRFSSTTLPRYLARNCKWAALGFVLGLLVLLAAFASNWIVGVFGFVVMLGSAIFLTHNLRLMGRHGIQQLGQSMSSQRLSEAIEEMNRKLRRRFGSDED